jgi:cytochrome P450
MLTDERAVAHVLRNAYQYPKPDFVRDSLATMAAGHDGLLTVEGETHRRQRKIIVRASGSIHLSHTPRRAIIRIQPSPRPRSKL